MSPTTYSSRPEAPGAPPSTATDHTCPPRRGTRIAARRAAGAAAFGALAAALAGCAHETATTTVRANGGWTRKAVFTIAQSDNDKATKKLALRDVFTPPSGAGWKVEQKTTGEKPPQITVTAIKQALPGETITGDLTVKSAAAKGSLPARVVNEATVRSAGPGRWLYTETFRWTGSRPAIGKDMAPLLGQSLKSALPAPFATDASVRELGPRLQRALWTTLFSPPEPLLLDFYDNLLPVPILSDPDERTGVMIRRLGPGIDAALLQTFGARMTPEQRHETAINIATRIASYTGEQAGTGSKMGGTAGSSPGTDSASESFGGMVPVAITLVVKMPGRVVETNGVVDDITGEVYWTLYPQAALDHDVTLRAVFDTKQAVVARELR
jgi:hypothetical protein